MNRILTGALLLFALATCKPETEKANPLKTGTWRAVIGIQGQELPFNIDVSRDAQGGYDVYILNGEERLLLDEVVTHDDSVDIALHIFDANIRARIIGDSLHGVFVKNFAKDYRLPFHAVYGQEYRFPRTAADQDAADFSGKYDVTFLSGTNTRNAIAILEQSGDRVTGTVLTRTGDYRYLDGIADGDSLKLSTFNGNDAYIFLATRQEDGTLKGEFFSGKTRNEQWTAERNEQAAFPEAESLTYLKEGYDRISFSFPDVNGKAVSLKDERYKGKVVILQLLGTWCPNCMDETRFLAPWYDENNGRGVEIIGLAFENKEDFNYASARVRKMVEKMDVHYPVVIAGTDDKEKRAQALPMLNAVVAFPTTIFIGKDGAVKKIHTGFNGPGTGVYYEQFKEEFNETVNRLLSEDLTVAR